jgi:ribosomal protein S18 acetylase RimI-like enzyme
MDLTIRTGRADEAPAFAELHLRTALHAYAAIFPPEAPAPTVAELCAAWSETLRSDERRAVFVAETNGDPVGVVVGGPDPLDGVSGHLSRLYVQPELWGRGIGRALHDRCIGHLRDGGFELASLWVLEANPRARSWYERLGWKITGARKPVYAPAGIDDVGYRLLLRR